MITDYKDLEPGSLYELFNERMIFIELINKHTYNHLDKNDMICSFFSLDSKEKYTFVFRRIIASSTCVKLC